MSDRQTFTVSEIRQWLAGLKDNDDVSMDLGGNWLIYRDEKFIGVLDFWSQEDPFLDMNANAEVANV